MMKPVFLRLLVAVCFFSLGISKGSAVEDADAKGLASRVNSIFQTKCSECHGQNLTRPKGGIYLHNLAPLAANPEWVVPHEPDKSYLWTLIHNGDMPVKGAKAGPLSAQEKETIRTWIKAGAPVASSLSNESTMPAPEALEATQAVAFPMESAPSSMMVRLLAWLGRFHLLAIHFPIALLAAAAFAELVAAWKGARTPAPTVQYCVLLATVSAVAAVGLGWLHADLGGWGRTSAQLLFAHRWLGTISGMSLITIAVLSERERRLNRRSRMFRIVLGVGFALVAAAAHFGGLMVHGSDFFAWG
jgi:mono/diheme cytochrome c family protein